MVRGAIKETEAVFFLPTISFLGGGGGGGREGEGKNRMNKGHNL